MDSKREVKHLLKESGHLDLFTEENYRIAKRLTEHAASLDFNLKTFFKILEGTKQKYIHDLIVKNKAK